MVELSMQHITNELEQIIEDFSTKLRAISDKEFSSKPAANKWSKKEVIGHLIDSAENNLRRFIVGQYDGQAHIVYDQDFWVLANGYQDMNQEEIIQLWKLINGRITAVLRNMPEENFRKQLNTGKTTADVHSLEWLAADYVKHLKHHLNQVLARSFDIVYP
jgi:hypothetical protein